MQAKTRNWTDVQLIISSISIAVTLGFWGLLTSREKGSAAVSGEANLPSKAASSEAVETLLPGQVLYLGTAAPTTTVQTTTQTKPKRRKGGGGGGGGGGGEAVASTGSS